jgi:hypothetical protein
MITGVSSEIRTGALLNTNLERNRDTIVAGGKVSLVGVSVALLQIRSVRSSLAVGFLPRRPEFGPREVHVVEVAIVHGFLQVIRFSPSSIISPLLCTHPSIIRVLQKRRQYQELECHRTLLIKM